MIYMVEIGLIPTTKFSWDQWQRGMKPAETLVSVPGFQTAQRFEGISGAPTYCALYTVDSAEVMTSRTYRGVGGGGTEGSWKSDVLFWTRDLFSGLFRAPKVPESSRLLVVDTAHPNERLNIPDITWTTAAGLDRSTPHRGFAVVSQEMADTWLRKKIDRLRVYRPMLYVEKSGAA